ncbi:MAG: hypothetical protein D3910_06990 [Candidatus Electrothrix sp. ATG2]|nr:hypothetical protein [Candidatus Electrothrix sp. ATG2]
MKFPRRDRKAVKDCDCGHNKQEIVKRLRKAVALVKLTSDPDIKIAAPTRAQAVASLLNIIRALNHHAS